MLFLHVINFVAYHSIDRIHIGIAWIVCNLFLDNLDFADDLVILGLTQIALRDLTVALENQAASDGLRINGQKTKVVRIGYVNSRVPVK